MVSNTGAVSTHRFRSDGLGNTFGECRLRLMSPILIGARRFLAASHEEALQSGLRLSKEILQSRTLSRRHTRFRKELPPMRSDSALALDQEMTDPVICQGSNLISHDRLADFAAQFQHRGSLLMARCGNAIGGRIAQGMLS